MTWRSRSLRVVPTAFPLLLPPDGAWARGRGHAHGHHHDHHHPSHHHVFGFGHPCGYAPCGCAWSVGCGHTLAPGSPQSSAKKTPAARGPPADHGSLMPGLTMQRAVGRVYVRVTSLTLVAYCSVQGSMSNAKIHGVRTGSSGQDPQADRGTAIGSREASDPNALRSGRAG